MRIALSGRYRLSRREDPDDRGREFLWTTLKRAGYRTLVVGDVARQEYSGADLREVPRPSDGETVVDAFLARLAELFEGPPPRAAWVHLVDPHAPYKPRGGGGGGALERYELCIRESDTALARLIPALEELAARHPLHIVFFSDHGEEFGDHGGQYHGTAWYEESARVPLFFVGPGVAVQRRDEAVSLADLAPTLLDLAGVAPPQPTHGRSLAPALRGEPLASSIVRGAVVRGGTTWSRSAVLEPWKVIVNHVSGTIEVYDLASDPEEQINLVRRFDELPDELRATVER
jgi:arylsulfatase A-like enzyme